MTNRMRMWRGRALAAVGLGALGGALAGCGKAEAPSGPGFEIAVAPLTLTSVTNACYRVTVTNGPNRTGDIVWQRDNVCADDYGDGRGAITYIGTCDADVAAQNSVTLELMELVEGSPTQTPIADADYQNPCGQIADWSTPGGRDTLLTGEDPYGPCTQNKTCVENADVRVDFDLTVMRRAMQGFFDVAVEFDDIFCSAKLDCQDELLHDADGHRSATAVVAFACTAGENEETFLYTSDLVLSCDDDGDPMTPAPYNYVMGASGEVPGQHGPVQARVGTGPLGAHQEPNNGSKADGVFQWATYQGDEQLTSNGQDLEKCYWNRAVGLDTAAFEALGVTSCTLSAIGTATDTLDGIATLGSAGFTYPIVRWSVVVYTAANATTGTPATLCGPNPLNGDGSGVTTEYVSASTDPQTLMPITGMMACGADVLLCAAGPIIGDGRDRVVASQEGETITVETGGQTATIPLTGALAGYKLGATCHGDGCCVAMDATLDAIIRDPRDPIDFDPVDPVDPPTPPHHP